MVERSNGGSDESSKVWQTLNNASSDMHNRCESKRGEAKKQTKQKIERGKKMEMPAPDSWAKAASAVQRSTSGKLSASSPPRRRWSADCHVHIDCARVNKPANRSEYNCPDHNALSIIIVIIIFFTASEIEKMRAAPDHAISTANRITPKCGSNYPACR